VIGRGALGNPWLFRDLKCLFEGRPVPERPSLQELVEVVRMHFSYLERHYAEWPRAASLLMRKFGAWYVRGLRGAAALRRELQRMTSREDLERVLDRL